MRNFGRYYSFAIAGVLLSAPALSTSSKCHFEFMGYKKDITWTKSSTQLRIVAERACTSRISGPMDLQNVSFSYSRFGKVVFQGRADKGQWIDSNSKIYLFNTHEVAGLVNYHTGQPLVVDYKAGYLTSPFGVYLNLKQLISAR